MKVHASYPGRSGNLRRGEKKTRELSLVERRGERLPEVSRGHSSCDKEQRRAEPAEERTEGYLFAGWIEAAQAGSGLRVGAGSSDGSPEYREASKRIVNGTKLTT